MGDTLKVASWNVNSLRVRLDHVLDWLHATGTDILGLQETKVTDDAFPAGALSQAGYDAIFSGQKTYNGVALLCRREKFANPRDVLTDIPAIDNPERRVLAASYGDWRVINLYVPNGQSVGSEKYVYKLAWLDALKNWLRKELRQHERVLVMGDFNIAPGDLDVHDPDGWRDAILCSQAERAALEGILDLGFSDTFRRLHKDAQAYSWWDYRAAAFRRDRGLRIDLILASRAAADGLIGAAIDRGPRSLERPSDHAPTVAEFTL